MQKFGHRKSEIRKDSVRFRAFFLFIVTCSYADSLKVTVPERNLTASRGHSVVLGCEFSPDLGENPDLSLFSVTWQRPEGDRVVHSYYFAQDQLQNQNAAYRNRTALFGTELRKGNASLKIHNVGVNDAGRYLCVVSSNEGTDQAELRLDYGALYTEPRLTIHVNSSEVSVQYETEGYPEAEVKWEGKHGERFTNQIRTSARLNTEEGLYYIRSSYTAPNTPLNFTFILQNQLLDQYMERPISYAGDQSSCFKEVVALSVISFLFILTAAIFAWIYFRTSKHRRN